MLFDVRNTRVHQKTFTACRINIAHLKSQIDDSVDSSREAQPTANRSFQATKSCPVSDNLLQKTDLAHWRKSKFSKVSTQTGVFCLAYDRKHRADAGGSTSSFQHRPGWFQGSWICGKLRILCTHQTTQIERVQRRTSLVVE